MQPSPEKVTHALLALMMFLDLSRTTQTLPDEFVLEKKAKCAALLNKIPKDVDKVVIDLNKLIDEINLYLKAPYPSFVMDSWENLVKSEIVAFEHFLFQELKANHLTIQQEAPLFNDSLHLWEKVGAEVTPSEALLELSSIVARANKLLPEDEKYPFPEKSDETRS